MSGNPQDIPIGPFVSMASVANDVPMVDDAGTVVTAHAAYTADVGILALARRKAWVKGVLKQDSFVYFSSAVTASGTITFYITSDGTSSGTAVFTNVYVDSITVSPYGASAIYQVSNIVVAGDKKSITATVNQVTSVLVGLLQVTGASNGIACNMLVLGD